MPNSAFPERFDPRPHPARPCTQRPLAAIGLLIMLVTAAPIRAADDLHTALPETCMPGDADYSLLWWENGWDDRKPVDPKLLAIRTGRYGMTFDVDRPQRLRLGLLAAPSHYAAPDGKPPTKVANLPASDLVLRIRAGLVTYTCTRAAGDLQDWLSFPVRIIESGRFLQRFDLQQLEFASPQGTKLDAEARLEVVAWPDRLAFLLEVTPKNDLREARLELGATVGKERRRAQSESIPLWKGGITETTALAISFEPDVPDTLPPIVVEASNLRDNAALTVSADPVRGWHAVALPSETWSVRDDLDHLERVRLKVSNPADHPQPARLLLAKDYPFEGITGLSPMLRDRKGIPTGLAVQISKNWHNTKDRPMLYEGPWFHGFTFLRIPPRATLECELTIAYGRWGGVPAASHAQLCLIGWGGNQRWDQVAIGSWGESICYDPDAIQRRCAIDDLRPLMVSAMESTESEPQKWNWTNNVGGGDFLVYHDNKGKYQPLSGVRTTYLRTGPNLTEARYTGRSADGRIAARIEVSTPRVDDLNRAYHRLRYDVLKPTPFTRLAFYQVGADRYHGHAYNLAARGDASALVEEWRPDRGGLRYVREAIPCTGTAPWFSLHDALVPENTEKPVQGAWANRGLIVRSWKARLGGRDVPPFAAMFGTEDGKVPSANLELTPPPGLKRLEPGDYVEAELELIVVPRAAADYYGPNTRLRQALADGANTWKPVLREAAGNDLKPRAIKGEIRRRYPLVVAVAADGEAEVEIPAGVGYVPVTFTGLDRHNGHTLLHAGKPSTAIDQSKTGNDFWQTDYDHATHTWERTYNLPLEDLAEAGSPARLLLRRLPLP